MCSFNQFLVLCTCWWWTWKKLSKKETNYRVISQSGNFDVFSFDWHDDFEWLDEKKS